MLKADLHIHTKEDPQDIIRYNARKLIDKAALQGFDVISITNHDIITYSKKLVDYAKKKGILLIPGTEVTIKGKHLLIYNITNEELFTIKSIDDLKMFKRKRYLIVVPHPFFLKKFCLSKELIENTGLFDAIEFSSNYSKRLNINKKAIMFSKKKSIPLIGASDSHSLKQFGSTYTLIDADKNIESIFNAIKNSKIEIITKPSTLRKLGFHLSKVVLLSNARRIHRKILI